MPIMPGSMTIPGSSVALGRLGLGCARLFSGAESRQSTAIIEQALSAGIRHFDTAPTYSGGQSEQLLGQVLAGVPDVTIATKVGMSASASRRLTWWSSWYRRLARPVLARTPTLKAALLRGIARPSPVPASSPAQRALLKEEIRASLEQSLQRLRRSRVDVLLVHEPDGIVLDEALLQEFLALQREGLIGAFGLGWGRSVNTFAAFGQIVQSRYEDNAPPSTTASRIYHGVLRMPCRSPQTLPAAVRLRSVLLRHPDAGILFSVSAPSQIRDIANSWTIEEQRMSLVKNSREAAICKPT